MTHVRLDPMTVSEFEDSLERSTAVYAAERVVAGDWPQAQSLALSRAEFAVLLPEGAASPRADLSVARDARTGERVGFLYLGLRGTPEAPTAYIYNIEVDEHLRGRGYGRATMLAAADRARQLGAKTLELHVFAHNTVAWALYTSLGFAMTGLSMSLAL